MSRINIPSRDEAPVESQPTLDNIAKRVGFIPNLFRLMAVSPATLAAQGAFQGALNQTLNVALRTKIALTVSQVNNCKYCLTAHAYHAVKQLALTPGEVSLNCNGLSNDPKEGAALRFAKVVTELRGHISNADLAAVKEAGFTDAEVLEIVAVSVSYLLTNFLNNVADTDVDFPDLGVTESSD